MALPFSLPEWQPAQTLDGPSCGLEYVSPVYGRTGATVLTAPVATLLWQATQVRTSLVLSVAVPHAAVCLAVEKAMKPVVVWHCTQSLWVLKSNSVHAGAVVAAWPVRAHCWRIATFAAVATWQFEQEACDAV